LDYLAATSLEEAVAALAGDEDAKVLAGGQSLVPLLNLRLARPTVLVDIDRLGLDQLTVEEGMLRAGAMVRQRRLELDPIVAAAVPLLSDAVAQVGYPATRNRGTFGGSLAHADPVAELPAVAVALGGSVVVTGPSGSRRVACADLADGYFTTTLAPDEIITEVQLPVAAGPAHGAAWCEWAPRAHDFAEAGVGVAVDVDDTGTCTAVWAAACGIGGGPLALGDAVGAAGVLGCSGAGAPLLRGVAAAVEEACGAAGAGGRGELAGLLAARAVRRALERAGHRDGRTVAA
jgi:carbon-monoxide dehydrogenase medium subunit